MLRIILLIFILMLGYLSFVFLGRENSKDLLKAPLAKIVSQTQFLPSPSPKIELLAPSSAKILASEYHVFQTFNNCGPAALSMTLAFYGINVSQLELGQSLRPYQVPGGDNDDKSVTLEELGEKAKEYGLIPFHRPNGNIELIKLFISYDIPVITRTWLKETDDIGHYRVVKGYDDIHVIQDDSYQGKNLKYTQAEFNAIWKKFNYEYLVLIPPAKLDIAEAILAENFDPKIAWGKAVKLSQEQLSKNPDDIYARFNLSVAFFNIGEYQKSVEEFEKVESKLPFRTLWYQIEPIQAYYKLGNYQRVFEITERVLNNYNRAFSELYLIRGEIYQKQANMEKAKSEFQKAYFYNQNLKAAKQALESL